MSLGALRNWGLVVTAALMIGALALSRTPETQAQPLAEIAQANAAPAGFIVRFQGQGPIARAQASAQSGNETRAQRAIEAQLARQAGLAGLCFDRFTVGAAEIVLRTCEPVAASERAATEQRWLSRLRAMRAVAYADLNAVGQTRAG